MKRLYASLLRASGKNPRLLKTLHGVCIGVCLSIAGCSLWLVNQTNEISRDELNLPMPVEEAERLVQNGAQWIAEWNQERERERRLREAAAQATSWVPRQLDWQHTMTQIQSLAASCEVQLVEIQPGEEYDGPRVAVRTAVCQVEGTYPSVCRFLDGLVRLDHPLWASELTMQSGSEDDPLAVTIHLRIPVAGTRTASAFLIEMLKNQPSPSQPEKDTRRADRSVTEATRHG
ncbi:MAG: hypothetical protein ACO1RT_04985 [Planctomycetaceae bacterium]